jgi:signal transduction histidine kinase
VSSPILRFAKKPGPETVARSVADSEQSSASSVGLRGMKERALAVKGHIEIESTPELGTRVRAIFPITRK